MSRFGVSALLAAVALLLMLTVDSDGAPLVSFAALLIMGLALALTYDPIVAPLLRARRAPGWHDIGLLLLCLPIALMVFGAVELFLPLHWRLAWSVERPLADGIEWLLALTASLAPVAVLAATAFMPRQPRGTRAPLWPLAAGLGSALFGWLGGGFAWLATVRPLLEGQQSLAEAALPSPPAFAMAALGLGIGTQFWWRAVHHRGNPRFNGAGMFRSVITATIAATAVGLAAIVTFVLPLSPAVARFRATVLAGWMTVPLAITWLVALGQIRRVEPSCPYTPVAAVALLLVALPLSFAPAMLLADSREWAELFLLLATPFAVAACLIVLLLVPRLVTFVLNPPPSTRAAPAGRAR